MMKKIKGWIDRNIIKHIGNTHYESYKRKLEPLSDESLISLKLDLETNVEFKSFWFSFSMVSTFLFAIWSNCYFFLNLMGSTYAKQITEMTVDMRVNMLNHIVTFIMMFTIIILASIVFLRNGKKEDLRHLKFLNYYLTSERGVKDE